MFLVMLLSAAATPPDADALHAELGLSVSQLIDALPACTSTQGSGQLDLRSGCVDGVCLGDEVEAVNAECKDGGGRGIPICAPAAGVSFWDHRADPTRVSTQVVELYLRPDFTGKTRDGLGVGTSMACWLAVLGTPDEVELSRSSDRFVISRLRWREPKVWVSAEDGWITKVTLLATRSR